MGLEQEENKVLRSQLELTQVRQEIERRIAEKDEEFLSTKKNFTKGIDGMQTALEQEAKGKAEALRMKKKLEADVSELETALEHANAANAETQKTIKKYHGSIRDAQAKLEGEQRAKPTPPRMLLKRLALSLNNLTVPVVSLNKNFQTPMNNFQNSLARTKQLLVPRGSLSLKCRPCMAIWMKW